MNIVIVGCGFVADYYMASLAHHPSLRVVGAYDKDTARTERFGAYWKTPVFGSAEEMLASAPFDMVLNLTNPASHYEVSRRFLEAGKHVYSEKPLAMVWSEAKALVELAAERGLTITSAPCIHLGETAQALRRAVEEGQIGRPRLIYAEMDDNFVALSPYRKWKSQSGVPWPYEDEFEVGCTLEHAGYCLAMMMNIFGPIRRVTSFASLQHPGKPTAHGREGADFSVACLDFHDGMVARLTCSILAPRNHLFTVVGDEGLVQTDKIWTYRNPVITKRYLQIRRRFLVSPIGRRVPLVPAGPVGDKKRGTTNMDFARGPAEVAAALAEGRRSRMPADFVLHLNEVALAIGTGDAEYLTTTTFAPIDPVTHPIV